MKNLLFFACLFLASCQSNTPQKKSERAISAYLKETLNDPASYESVKFDSLKIEMSKIENDEIYSEADREIKLYLKLSKDTKKEFDIDIKFSSTSDDYKVDADFMGRYADSIKKYTTILQARENTFKAKNIGYTLYHSYRGKNKMNALILEEANFHLDSALKVKDYTN